MRTPRRLPTVAAVAVALALQVGTCTALTTSLLGGPLLGNASAATADPSGQANPVSQPSQATSTSPHLALSLDSNDGGDSDGGGQAGAAPGERLTWKLTVRDLGKEPVTDLRIEQHLPDGAKPVGSADAVLRDGKPVWEHVAVRPDTPTTLTSTADLGPAGPETLDSAGTASTACAYAGTSSTPLVCASHLDPLPAGRRGLAVAGHEESPAWPWWTGGALAALTAVAAVIWVRGRRAVIS
ncbi:hypothetical protein [Kitasatospora viridis]|uniref:DUF11 domain-containing protein n=1 Tax=Kitasatospora viridis TaxID=281105 RepID=A0A561T7F3_9ACTN|nr:hypothetical protein [Kitasatospora viridis]TWF83041.1 hypothetical protein FHX73_14524 [Kitasatospora viridis]